MLRMGCVYDVGGSFLYVATRRLFERLERLAYLCVLNALFFIRVELI